MNRLGAGLAWKATRSCKGLRVGTSDFHVLEDEPDRRAGPGSKPVGALRGLEVRTSIFRLEGEPVGDRRGLLNRRDSKGSGGQDFLSPFLRV